LSYLAGGRNADEEPNSTAIEEGHLWWGRKQKGEAKDIAIERNALLEVLDRNEQLRDICVCEIHLESLRD
jgi:hypothetical protein